MRRVLFHICAGASLLLWLAACSFWIRGFWVEDSLALGRQIERGEQVISQTVFYSSDCCQFGFTLRTGQQRWTSEQLEVLRARSAYSFEHFTRPTRPFTLLPGDPSDSIWNRF